jgi:hypothetical protein
MEGDKLITIQFRIEQVAKIAEINSRWLPFAADLVEMVIIPGATRVLETADKRMEWWRTNNLDIWLILASILIGLFFSVMYTIFMIIHKL